MIQTGFSKTTGILGNGRPSKPKRRECNETPHFHHFQVPDLENVAEERLPAWRKVALSSTTVKHVIDCLA